MGQVFDWQTFIDIHKPSRQPASSQIQKERQVLLDSLLLPDLHTWVGRQKLQVIWEGDMQMFSKYLHACAFTSALRIFNPYDCCCHNKCRTHYNFWLASLDQYLDHNLLGSLIHQDWHIDQKIAYLDSKLAGICEQFLTFGELTSQQMQEASLPFDLLPKETISRLDVSQFATDYLDDPVSSHNIPLILKEAWADIYDTLKVHLLTCQGTKDNGRSITDRGDHSASDSSGQDAENSFFLSKFVYETAVAIGGMRDEIIYSLRFHFDQKKPDFEDLLVSSMRTMCLEPITALAILLDSVPACSEDWDRWLPIMKQAAKVNRLVNDCARVSRELAEGKMSCVTVLLNSLDYSTVENQEVQAAIDIVRQRRATELDHFRDLIYNMRCKEHLFTTPDYSIHHTILGCVSYRWMEDAGTN